MTEGVCGILLTGNDWAAGVRRMESYCGEWRGVGRDLGRLPRAGWQPAVPGRAAGGRRFRDLGRLLVLFSPASNQGGGADEQQQ